MRQSGTPADSDRVAGAAAERSQIQRLGDLPITASAGTVPLSELGHFRRTPEEDLIFHEDLRPVEYVVADVGGRLAAPVDAMFQIEMCWLRVTTPRRMAASPPLRVRMRFSGSPVMPDDARLSWEWAGERTVTYETFRDMGAAFVVALVLIYILVVWIQRFPHPVDYGTDSADLAGHDSAYAVMFALGLGGEFTRRR